MSFVKGTIGEREEVTDNLKPKERLLAVMFGAMVTGLGQIYAGNIKRGILFFSIPFILAIPHLLGKFFFQELSKSFLILASHKIK